MTTTNFIKELGSDFTTEEIAINGVMYAGT